MSMRSQDVRATLARGARHWQLLALPVTFLSAAALLINGTTPPLAPPTGPLIHATADAPLLTRTTASDVELLYADPRRGALRTLRLKADQRPRVTQP